jgi:hypothetical protein
VIELKEQE